MGSSVISDCQINNCHFDELFEYALVCNRCGYIRRYPDRQVVLTREYNINNRYDWSAMCKGNCNSVSKFTIKAVKLYI